MTLMTPQTIGRGHRAAGIYEELRQRIDTGTLTPGERLPPQRKLAAEFEASITTVNKAISRLQSEELVWARQGSGVFVSEPAAPTGLNRTIAYMYNSDFQELVPVQHAALEHGCLLSVFSQLQSRWHPQAERLFLQQVRDQHHMALLAFCSPTEPRNDDLLQELTEAGTRVIHLEHYRQELPDQEYLMPDYQRAARMAAVELALAGYDHLVYYGHPFGLVPGETQVHLGMREARDDYGVPMTDDYHLQKPRGTDDFVSALVECFRPLPANTGVVMRGTEHTHMILEALSRLGRRVPEDIGLLAVEMGHSASSDVDLMFFNRQGLVRQAVEAIVSDTPVHQLVRPTRIRHGLVRSTT